ncbi:MAG: S-adenosylmethionine:tRNA ribosyltransferase-isomerase, partial [Candidatus Aminicenantes bacterium]
EAVRFKTLDLERYQTVYSKIPGSIAAPTAGLHFTPEVIEKIKQKTEIIEITLEVGEATFRKIEVEDIADHQMGRETVTITKEDRKRILRLRQSKQLIAVGTTTVRSLETFALHRPGEETFYSELFITPGFEFKLTDKLITNFHLPESSLFILVSAFAGLELMKKAYRAAVEEGYRFFSYGDAMFIV